MQIRPLPAGSLLLLFAITVVFQNAILAQDLQPKYFDLPRGTAFQLVDESGTPLPQDHQFGIADSTERLIYSNTLGRFVVPLPADELVADDISTMSTEGCLLHRFTFQVMGQADPNAGGGAFSVQYALYQDCPGAYSKAQRDLLVIPGTFGKAIFSDPGSYTVVVEVPPGTVIPMSVYLGIVSDRENVGMVMGAPPLVGHSSDRLDWPGFPCNAYLGGFPNAPHASANAEIWADASCPAEFVGYRNHNPARFAFNPGIGTTLADDIHLNINYCMMSSYEVTVKGVGRYVFDLRGSCATTIPGTLQTFNINTVEESPQRHRFTFSPPIFLPEDFWITVQTNNPESGIVMTGDDASTGHTEPSLALIQPDGTCATFDPANSLHGGLDITITCDGSPPVGACCDMFVLNDNGDAVCREVPRMNCPFPPQDNDLMQPKWVQGSACAFYPSEAGPFPLPCGLSACCGVYERTDPFNPDGPTILVSDCENQTQNDCFNLQPFDLPRKWERGLYCGQQGQGCPRDCEYGDAACCAKLYELCSFECFCYAEICYPGLCEPCRSQIPECRVSVVCGQGNVGSAMPPNNFVDARRPFAPDDLLHPLGIDSAVINARIDIPSECFHLCETRPETLVNGIDEISTTPDGYAIQFLHPVSPGSLIVIRQAGDDLNRGVVYISHPGNVNGDDLADADDVLSLVARLKGGPALLWGTYSEDIDQSGMLTPLDLLDLLDLLNGAGAYYAWNGTSKPIPNANCP